MGEFQFPPSGTFVGLNQLPIDKDAILLRTEACQKKLSLLLDDHGVLLLHADRKFVAFGEAEREHAKVLYCRLAVNQNVDISDKLVEREIDPMLFVNANIEAELHACSG